MTIKKEITRNLLSLGSVDLFGLLIPIITMPILSRALNIDIYGQYMLFLTVATFGQTIVDYGVQYIGVREVNQSNEKTKIYEELQGVRFALFIIFILFLYLYYEFFSDSIYNLDFFCSIVAYLFGYIFLSAWFLIGVGKSHVLLFFSLVSKIINLLVILFLVKEPQDVVTAIYSFSIPSLFFGIVAYIYIFIKFSCKPCSFKSLLLRLRNGFDVFVGILSPNLYNSIPIMILGSISNPIDFAKFAIASRLCNVIVTALNVLAKSIFPIISKFRDNNSYIKYILYSNLMVIIPMIAFVFLFGEDVISIFLGKEYAINNIYLNVLVISTFFIGIANAYGQGYFLVNRLDSLYKKVSLRVSILSGLLSILLIYLFGVLGGAIGIVIARSLFALDFYVLYRKTLRCSLYV